MPCPQCTCTLQSVTSREGGVGHYHCPRCGTWVIDVPDRPQAVYSPTLLGRLERLIEKVAADATAHAGAADLLQLFHMFGINEAVFPPSRRPAV
jgi:hypothetical protein